jgi:hypothetical protein
MVLTVRTVNSRCILWYMNPDQISRLQAVVFRLLGRPFALRIMQNRRHLGGRCELNGAGLVLYAQSPGVRAYPMTLDRGWGSITLKTVKQGLSFIVLHEAAHGLSSRTLDVIPSEESADILAVSVYNDLLSEGAWDRLEIAVQPLCACE